MNENSLTPWLLLAIFGTGGAVLCLRCGMIQASMVAELLEHDPTFQPKNAMGSLDPAVRTYNVREYKRRLPNGRLTPKLRHTYWMLAVWAVLMFGWILSSGTLP